MQWLRLYHDTAHDPKWRVVAVESEQPLATVLGVWTYMLIFASQAKTRGTLEGWNDRVAGAALDIKGDTMTAIRQAMQGVVLDGDVLTGWDRRQRNSDNVAERVRKHREANRPVTPDNDPSGVTSENVTEHSENVTLHKDDVTLRNGTVTENPLRAQTTDSDTEQESKEESPPPPKGGVEIGLFGGQEIEPDKPRKAKVPSPYTTTQIDDLFDQFMAAYPHRDKQHSVKGARRLFGAAVKRKVDPAAIIAAATRYCHEAKSERKIGTVYVKDAFNWLNESRWENYSGVHPFPSADKTQDGVYKFDGDKNNPPVGYDDAPTGTKKGWWCKTSRGWNRYAS